MADPMRIRAQASGGKATVRVLMSHEMETGQRRDSAGKPVPAWFIQDITASLNGKPVLTCWLGEHVAKEGRAILEAAGIASFETPAEVAAVLRARAIAAQAIRGWVECRWLPGPKATGMRAREREREGKA